MTTNKETRTKESKLIWISRLREELHLLSDIPLESRMFNFVRNLLSTREAEWKEDLVGKVNQLRKDYRAFMSDTKSQARSNLKVRGYNQALDKVLGLLEGKNNG